LIFLGIAVAGLIVCLSGLGTPGPCGDFLGWVASFAVWIGGFVGTVLLLIVGARANWRRSKHRHAHTAIELTAR